MEGPLPIALVGAGRIAGLGWIPALRRARGVHLAGIVDTRIERARSLAGPLPYGESLADLAARTRIGAVVIATPPEHHLVCAAEAAGLGLRSLIEKPPARTTADARSLVALRPVPSIGFNRRFEPGWRELVTTARAASGELRIEADFDYEPRAWGVGDEAAFLDAGSHLIDVALRALGPVAGYARLLTSGEREQRLELQHERGTAALTVRSRAGYRERATLSGDGKAIARVRLDGPLASLKARLRSGGAPRLAGSLAGEVEAFAKADEAVATAADGLAVMEVLAAAGALP